MGGWDVPVLSAFPTKYADLVRGVGLQSNAVSRVIWSSIGRSGDGNFFGRSSSNFSKSANSFRQS